MKRVSTQMEPELEQWLEQTNKNFDGIFNTNGRVVLNILTILRFAYPDGLDDEWHFDMRKQIRREEKRQEREQGIIQFPG